MISVSHLISPQFSWADSHVAESCVEEVNFSAETQPLVENNVCLSAGSESQSISLEGCACCAC